MKKFLVIVTVIFLGTPVLAWDGYDYETSSYIEIEQGNYVRPGNEIEIYDYGDSRYKTYEVESINGNEVEVYDYQTGTYRTFDMDD